MPYVLKYKFDQNMRRKALIVTERVPAHLLLQAAKDIDAVMHDGEMGNPLIAVCFSGEKVASYRKLQDIVKRFEH